MKNKENMIATVDLGSNSFRLQICLNENGQLQVVDSIKEMVRLAAGLDNKKNLSRDAQARALATLARFAERLRGFKSTQVRVVATNTFRVAIGIHSFIEKAEKTLGFPIEIIAGREEARLIYTGVAHTLPFHNQKALVVDIGGGSTEFIIGSGLQPQITESLHLGCVSYSMRFFAEGKISEKSFNNAVNTARTEVQRIGQLLRECAWDFSIGTSGSARAIRDVIFACFNEEEKISLPHMRVLSGLIINAGSTKKAKLAGMKSERIEVFAGGLAVMIAIFEELDIKEMVITDAALRDGVFYDLIGRHLDSDMRDQTITVFQQRYHVDNTQADRMADIALRCLKGVSMQMSKKEWAYWQRFIVWAAKVHEIGLSIAHTAYHKHSSYILEHADMPGFSRKDQKILAALVLGHRGDLRKMQDYVNHPIMFSAILCLRLSALFCRARGEITFPENTTLHINASKKKSILHINKEWLKSNPLTATALEMEDLAWQKIHHQFTVKKQ